MTSRSPSPSLLLDEINDGSQFKLQVFFDNEVVALFRPKRTLREQQAPPNQVHVAEFERHTSEIAAFHLDRILGFYRAMPTVGRNVNMITEMLRVSEPRLQRTFSVSPKPDENVCFTGNCKLYCDSYHPICGNGIMIEVCSFPFFEIMKQIQCYIKIFFFVQRDHCRYFFLKFTAQNEW